MGSGQVMFSYSQQHKSNLSPQIFLCGWKGALPGACANSMRSEEPEWDLAGACCLGTQAYRSSNGVPDLDGMVTRAQERQLKDRSPPVSRGCQLLLRSSR